MAINSFTVFAGNEGCTISVCVTITSLVIGAKSRTGSYGSFAYSPGLMASAPVPFIINV